MKKYNFIYLWFTNVMVYGFQTNVFIAFVVFILQIKKHYFLKYQHLFFNQIFSKPFLFLIYLRFINVMVYGLKIVFNHFFSKNSKKQFYIFIFY